MSTDNSTILRNSVGRSLFGLQKNRKTTQRVGSVAVTACELAMPNETLSMKRGAFYELKPTVQRIASTAEVHNMSVSIPFRSVIRYWDEFISKGDLIVQNGAMNVPFIQHREDMSVYQLPYTTPLNIIGMFLASVDHGNGYVNANSKLCFMQEVDAETTIADMPDGNKQDYDYSSLNANGLYCKTTNYYDTTFRLHPDWWWLPRLIGGGINESGVNLNMNYDKVGAYNIGCLHFKEQSLVHLARLAFNFCKAANSSASFALKINDVTCLKVPFHHDTATGRTYFGLAVGDNNYSVADSAASTRWLFYVVGAPNDTEPYGTIVPILQTEYDSEGTYSPTDFVMCTFPGADVFRAFAIQAVITAIFNRSTLLGYGSLMESLGHSLFEPRTMYDLYTSYLSLPDYPVQLGYAFDSVFDVLNINLFTKYFNGGELEISDKVNVIPYFCYQKTCTDRFLLDHEILSNNTGEDSEIDFEVQFDSPYWRNNMIPTMYYGHPTKDGNADVLKQSTFYRGNTWYLAEDGTAASALRREDLHYIISVNSMLTIFLDRGTLLSMDVFTKIWQKENRNVQNILDLSGYGVNNEGTIQAKQFLLAKQLCKYVMYGNTDQLASSVIEKHFGVNDVPSNHREVVVLDMARQTLGVQDVMNQGGGVDESGNPIALGDKVSVMSNSIPERQVFECYEKEFSYVLNLHWFTLDYERYGVPNPSVHILEKIQSASTTLGDVRRAFQLALFPEFQSTGDEMLHLDDIEAFASPINVAWTNKNNTMKDGYTEYMGEWKNRFLKQIWSPYMPYRPSPYAPSLTYGYLMPTPFQYDLHLVDKFGDSFLCGHIISFYKKSIMTRANEVGLVGM